MISICIPVVHGKYIREVLNSIFDSKYQEFEIIVSDASVEGKVSDILSEYDLRRISVSIETKLMEGRYIPHTFSRGEFELHLDETRLISRDLLKKLSVINHRMVAIGELELGDSLWIKMANIDKNLANRISETAQRAYIFPRYYEKCVIERAFNQIIQNLGYLKTRKITYDELHILYYEASKFSNDIVFMKGPEIYHHGDSSLLKIIRKYYVYGKSSRELIGTPYEFILRYRNHKRLGAPLRYKVPTLPLFFARSIAFLIGRIGY